MSFGFADGQTVPSEENTYYCLESINPSESVTLLDEANEIEILIDNAFVGGFEQYNSSKIVFKFSESAAGSTSTSFIFLASQSSGLVFTHHNDSTADSVFEGQIGVVNLDSFSDEDDQPDAFDLDSDNDGCFDAIEAGFFDSDNNGRVGVDPLTIDDNTVSNRGEVLLHTYQLQAVDNNNNSIYDFQEYESPAEISPNGNPISVSK